MSHQFDTKGNGAKRLGTQRIYEELKAQIAGDVYPGGSFMPSTRALAAELGVARSTVTLAYEQLLSEGFIESSQGARTRVVTFPPMQMSNVPTSPSAQKRRVSSYGERLTALLLPVVSDGAGLIADFRYGDLASADFPTLAWKRAVDATIKQRRERLAYDDPCGSLALRSAIQGYLWRARGIRSDLGRIIIVNGSQQGLDLCARLLIESGDRVVVEDPCYVIARHTFEAIGAQVCPVEVDDEGIKTHLLANFDARLAYVTPSHQYPLGGVLPIGRRNELLVWSQRHGAYVIEDDYDSEYRYDTAPIPPLHGMVGADHVIYLGTLSKTLSPTLRLGYLVVPSELSALFAAAKRLADRHAPLLEQEAAARFIVSGAYERHVRRTRRQNSARRATLLKSLRAQLGDRVTIAGQNAGLHVIVWCNNVAASEESRLIERAQKARIGLYPVTPTYAHAVCKHRDGRAGLVMGYASLDERQIERGVGILATVL